MERNNTEELMHRVIEQIEDATKRRREAEVAKDYGTAVACGGEIAGLLFVARQILDIFLTEAHE